MACGTGKTLVARVLHDEMGSRRTLVLVPSLSLLKQTLREWLAAGTFDYLAVCSDETVTPDDADAVVSSTSELGVPVTTDPAQIGAFLRARGGGVVFATYQSSPQDRRRPGRRGARVRPGGRRRGPPLRRPAGRGVRDRPRRGEDQGAQARVHDRHAPLLHRAGQEGGTGGRLGGRVDGRRGEVRAGAAPAHVRRGDRPGPALRLPGGRRRGQRPQLPARWRSAARSSPPTARRSPTPAPSPARSGLLRAMRKYDLHRVVSFHSRIDNATRFATSRPRRRPWMPDALRPTGELWAEHVSGRMTTGERETRLNRLRAVGGGERGVLTNARCLSEGVDVPTLDGVAFIDPRRSQVDIVQAVGRAIRKADDKTHRHHRHPRLRRRTRRPRGRARRLGVRPRLAGRPCAARPRRRARRRTRRRPPRTRPTRNSRGATGEDRPRPTRHRRRRLRPRLRHPARRFHNHELGALVRSARAVRHSRRPHPHPRRARRGRLPAREVGQQRSAPPTERVSSSARADRATRGPPGLGLGPVRHRLGGGFLPRRAVRHPRRPHPRPRRVTSRTATGWGRGSRSSAAVYRKGQLPAERISRLEAIPGWVWNPRDADWEAGFSHLERFATREGHTRIPQRAASRTATGSGRGSRRSAPATARGRLSGGAELARLEALPGWVWNPLDANWEAGFSHLERFATREGHTRVPASCVEDGYRLGQWVKTQRVTYRAGRLSGERAARLEALPGWNWDPFDTDWENGFSHLEWFATREGHTRVPASCVEGGYRLGQWARVQRRVYRKGQLPGERAARLEALPGWNWGTPRRPST